MTDRVWWLNRAAVTAIRTTLIASLLSLATGPAVGLVRAQDMEEGDRIAVARELARATVAIGVGQSGGSGFVVNDRGWIVTNAHVIRGFGGTRVLIQYTDGTTVPGRVLAVEADQDLAILAPEGQVRAPPLALGDSDQVQVGQSVLAFGSPFGLTGTLTQGIVSARRDLPGVRAVRGLIQTDAPINPGNSGGPLVNGRGEVIGVNTAILSRTGGSHGIGFAVPANYVRDLVARTEQAASAPPAAPDAPARAVAGSRVWLGILGEDFRRGGLAGVRVHEVVPDGPAAKAGILGAGDPPPEVVARLGVPWAGYVIVAVDGEPVRGMADLQRLIGRHAPAETARLEVALPGARLRGQVVVELSTPP
jgi:putative serine protease PepD